MNIIQRMQSPTPTFFKKVRKIGLVLAAVSGTVLAAQVALPEIVITVASYMGVIGSVVTAISQAATEEDLPKKKESYQ
jgi:hypothetical protein